MSGLAIRLSDYASHVGGVRVRSTDRLSTGLILLDMRLVKRVANKMGCG
jgi:hypothetical protein